MSPTTSKKKRHKKLGELTSVPEHEGYKLVGRLWVEKDRETSLGWGKVVLMERIAEYGSINAAARSMQMGYRHAWDLVDEINRLAPQPLVIKETGGSGGGGSRLTPEGKAAVANFWKLVESFNLWLRQQEPQLWLSKPERVSSAGRSRARGRERA